MVILICFLLLIGILAACAMTSDQMQGQTKQNETEESSGRTKATSDGTSPENKETMEQTGYTAAVPSSYKTASGHPGTVTRLDYDSKDYVRDGATITKTAYVYTPYGYDEKDEETRYNIVYLMHGWGGHAGEYFEFTSTKNMFDHLIENGDIPPMVIVSATFYNENSNTDFSGSIAEFRQFHRDFEENLMPAVEGQFHTYARSVRVIKYEGNGRIGAASKEQVVSKGYACGFEGLIAYITNLLPSNEVIGKALRKVVPMYPDIAVRELVANCLIHQNFFMQGTSPLIEIFSDRMEITNPGSPLIDKARFVDHPPISRNEQLASFMRRIGVCEERGSGYDKVVFETEFYQLPAPEIEIYNDHTKVILYAHKEYAQMSKEDRYRACYLHACLKRVNREYMTNASLRERFNIDRKNISMVSRLLSDTCALGLIYVSPDSTSDKNRKYLPFWA